MKKREIFKRTLCSLLAFLMLFSTVPPNAFALSANAAETDDLCVHHPAHEGCGYVAAVAGNPCAHADNHDESCGYREGIPGIACDHVHGTEECGTPVVTYPGCAHVCTDGLCAFTAEIPGSSCDHTHAEECGETDENGNYPGCVHTSHQDCAYADAIPGTPCDHVHGGEICGTPDYSYPDCGHTHGSCAYTEEITAVACTHVHGPDCGYVPAVEGVPCDYDCQDCKQEEPGQNPVENVIALFAALPAADSVSVNDLSDEEKTALAGQVDAALAALEELWNTDEEQAALLEAEYADLLINAITLNDMLTGNFASEYATVQYNPNSSNNFTITISEENSGKPITGAAITVTHNGDTHVVHEVGNGQYKFTKGSNNWFWPANYSITVNADGYEPVSAAVSENSDSTTIQLKAVDLSSPKWESFNVYYIASGDIPNIYANPGNTSDYGPSADNTPLVTITVDTNKLQREYAEVALYEIGMDKNDWHFIPNDRAYGNDRLTATAAFWDAVWACMDEESQAAFQATGLADVFDGYVLKRMSGGGQHCDGILKVEPPIYAIEYYQNGTLLGATATDKDNFKTMEDVWAFFRSHLGIPGDAQIAGLKAVYLKNGLVYTTTLTVTSGNNWPQTHNDIRYSQINSAYYLASFNATTSTGADGYYKVTYTDGITTETIFDDQSGHYPSGSQVPAFAHPEKLDRKGYAFQGWSLQGGDGSLLSNADITAMPVTKDLTFHAMWSLLPTSFPATVNVLLNDSQKTDIGYLTDSAAKLYVSTDGVSYTELTRSEQGVYTAELKNGTWYVYTSTDGTTYTKLDDGALVINNASSSRDLKFYSVGYDLNGGTDAADFPITYHLRGSRVDVTHVQPTRNNYIFRNWTAGSAEYTSGSLLTNSITAPYTLTADWEETIDIKVNVTIRYSNGEHKDNAGTGVQFELLNLVDGMVNPTDLSRSLTADNCPGYIYTDDTETHEAVYTPEGFTFENVPMGSYTVACTKSDYNVTVTAGEVENGVQTIDVLLQFAPENFDLRFAVTMAAETPKSLYPRSVNMKVTYWGYDNDGILGWHIITQQANTSAVNVPIDPETGTGSGSYPVWKYWSDSTNAYEYRIVITSYVMPDGTVVAASGQTPNETYVSANGTYSAAISVNDGGRVPSYPEGSNTGLSGGYYTTSGQIGIPTATISATAYTVTFKADTVEGATVQGEDIFVLDHQLKIPEFRNYTMDAPTGYLFEGWYTKDGTVNGDWGIAAVAGTVLKDNTTLYAKWNAPLEVSGTVYVAGGYTLDGEYHYINPVDRTETVRINLRKQGSSSVVATTVVSVTYSETGELGSGTYTFTGIRDDGSVYYIEEAAANYSGLYRNEPASRTDSTEQTAYAAGNYIAVDENLDKVADVDAYLPFSPASFDLKYQVDATTIGTGFRPTAAEVLVTYNAGNSGIAPDGWTVISQMKFDSGYQGDVLTMTDGHGNGSTSVWNTLANGTTAYDYGICLDEVTGIPATKGDEVPYTVTYQAPAHWTGSGQSKLLEAELTPNQYDITYDLGIEQTAVSGMANAPQKHTWSYTTDLSGVIPVRPGFEFLGWFTDAEEGSKPVTSIDGSVAEDTTLYARWHQMQDVVNLTVTIIHSTDDDTTGEAGNYDKDLLIQLTRAESGSTIYQDVTGSSRVYGEEIWHVLGDDADQEVFSQERIFDGLDSKFDYNVNVSLDSYYVSSHTVESHEMISSDNKKTGITVYDVEVVLQYKPDLLNFSFGVEMDPAVDPSLWPVSAELKVNCWFDAPSEAIDLDWNTITQHYTSSVTVSLGSNGKGTGSYPVWQWLNQEEGIPYYYRIEVVSLTLADGSIVMTNTAEGDTNHDVVYSGGNYRATVVTSGCGSPKDSDGSASGTALTGAYGISSDNSYVQQGSVKAVITLNKAEVHFVSADNAMGTVTGNVNQTKNLTAGSGGYSGNFKPTSEGLVLTPAQKHIVFSHWTDANGAVVDPFATELTLAGGQVVEYTAHWKVNDTCTYTVQYLDSVTKQPIRNEKTVSDVEYGTQVITNNEKISIDGYVFDWASADSLTVGLTPADNVLKLYYAKDQWNDEDNSTETGDGIPDYKQTVIRFTSGNHGTVTGKTLQVVTLTKTNSNGQYTDSITPETVTIASDTHYDFDQWILTPGNKILSGENDPYTEDNRLEAVGGNEYTYHVTWKLHSYSYTVRYLEQDTNISLADPVTGTVTYDAVNPVTVTRMDITGYKKVSAEDPDTVAVKYEDNQEILFYYVKKTYNLTVNFVDIDTNEVLHEPALVQDLPYLSEPDIPVLQNLATIHGYTYVESDPAQLVIRDITDNTITLKYRINQYPITVHYFYDNVLDTEKTVTTTDKYNYGTLISDVWNHQDGYDKSGTDYVLHAITGTDSTIFDNTDINTVYVYYVTDVLKDNNKPADSDEIGDGIPDIYQATVTYEVVNGTWEDNGTDEPRSHVFTLYKKNKNGEWVKCTGTDVPMLGKTVPAGNPDSGFDNTPVWEPATPKEYTSVTGDATYVLAYSNPNTHNITVTVVNGSVSVNNDQRTEKHFTITVNDKNFAADDVDTTTLKFAPAAGHILWSVTVDNGPAELVDGSLTFDHDKDHTIEVVYEKDVLGNDGPDTGDGVPDKFQKKITYRIINGTWDGSDASDKVIYVDLETDDKYDVNGTASLDDSYTGKTPNAGYVDSGSWMDGTGTPVTFPKTVSGTNDELFIFSYQKKIPVTVTIEVIGGTSLPVASQTVYEYSTGTTKIQFTPLVNHSLVSAQVKLGNAGDWTELAGTVGFESDKITHHYTHDYTQDVHIRVVYKPDQWDDANDKETGGDTIPDEQQALVMFLAGENGSVSGKTTQVFTVKSDNSWDFTPVTATPDSSYRLLHWVDSDGRIWSTDELFGEDVQHTLQGGKSYVFTAVFTEKSYSYTVRYHFDGVMDETKTTVETADFNTQITLNPANRAGENGEYLLERVDPESKTIFISFEESRNVIDVYYVTDLWNDEDNSEVGGDDIPDKKQALVKFLSAGNGMVSGDTVQIFTLGDTGPNIFTPSTSVTTTADTGYVFSHWRKGDQTVVPFRPTPLTGGEELIYTAVFEKDFFNYTVEYFYDGVLAADKTKTYEAEYLQEVALPAQNERDGDYVRVSAGPDNIVIDADESRNVFRVYYVTDKWNDAEDSETGGDSIPDKYQVLVKFTTGDTTKGTVTGKVVQVSTFPENAISGNVTPSLEGVITEGKTVEEIPYAFDRWTRDTLPASVNPQETLTNIPGGTVITFYAHFDKDAYLDGDLQDSEISDAVTGGDGIPDKYQAKILYQVENGTWDGTAMEDILEVFTLYRHNEQTYQWDKMAVTLGDTVPVGMQPGTGYQNPGTWDAPVPTAATEVTGNAVYVYRYGEDARILCNITVTVENGTADPVETPVKVRYGEDQTVTFMSNTGYALDSVTVDGQPAQLTDGQYTFEGVVSDHKIHVVYAQDTWKDSDQTTDSTDADSETGGDGIPDYRQAVVKFVSADPAKGTIAGTSLYVLTLLEQDAYTGTFTASQDEVNAVPTTGYKLDHWELARETRSRAADNAAVNPYSALEITGGGLYTYTANFVRRIYIQVNPNGGIWKNSTEIQKIEIEDPEQSVPEGVPTFAGYLFDGWTRTAGAADSDVVYIYTAKWKPDYKDVFYPEADPDDSKPNPEEVPVQATRYIEIRPNEGIWQGSSDIQKLQITGDYTLADPIRAGYIFTGWVRTDGTEENVIYIFTAQWEKDTLGGWDSDGNTIGDGIPDKYQKMVIFQIRNGYWRNESWLAQILGQAGNDEDIVVWLTLVDEQGNWDTAGSAVLTAPTGMYAKSGYHKGRWLETPPTSVTGTHTETYTYKFSRIPVAGESPETGDTIAFFVILLILSGTCLTIILVYTSRKRRKHKN